MALNLADGLNRQMPIACGVVIHDGRILMVRRGDPELPVTDNLWELPGGKVNFGEATAQAAAREVLEETGYSVKAGNVLPLCPTNVWSYPDGRNIQVFLICHVCELITSLPAETADPKVREVCWMTPEEILAGNCIQGTDLIVRALTGDPFFKERFRGSAAGCALESGKLHPEILGRFLGELLQESEEASMPWPHGAEVLLGPSNGEDSAVVKAGDGTLVVTTDPITFSTSRLAQYCVSVNANDIAACGALPAFMTVVLLIPSRGGWTEQNLEETALELRDCCRQRGIRIVGGHTEITDTVNSPVMVGQMIGLPGPCGVLGTSGARPGDALMVTKWAGIEGTAIIAGEKGDMLKASLGDELIAKAVSLLDKPGISVLPDSMALTAEFAPDFKMGSCPLHAMHDVTEGGVATGAWEMASASGLGVRLYEQRVPILDETRVICDCFNLDPLGLISSGALLVALSPDSLERAVAILEASGINAAHIGDFTSDPQYVLVRDGQETSLPRFHADEVIRALK